MKHKNLHIRVWAQMPVGPCFNTKFNFNLPCSLTHKQFVILTMMLGLYLNTLIFGHNFCNMLRKLNELTMQREFENFVTNNVFRQKAQQQQNTKSNRKILARVGNRTATFRTPCGCVISGTPCQLKIIKISIAVKLLQHNWSKSK